MATDKVRTCLVEGCEGKVRARGYCKRHYQQFRTGRPVGSIRRNTRGWSLEARMAFYADRSGGPDACWLWSGSTRGNGYGGISVNGHVEYAHVVAYEMANGPVPEGLQVRHKCDVRKCVNPAHLLVGTVADNMRDKVERGRQARGERASSAKLTAVQVLEIRRAAAGGLSHAQLARRYGVSRATIQHAISGRNWGHLPKP